MNRTGHATTLATATLKHSHLAQPKTHTSQRGHTKTHNSTALTNRSSATYSAGTNVREQGNGTAIFKRNGLRSRRQGIGVYIMHTHLAHIHTMGHCHIPFPHSPTAREPPRLINHMRARQPASKHPQQLPRLVQPRSNRRTTHNPARPRGKNPQSVDYKVCVKRQVHSNSTSYQ